MLILYCDKLKLSYDVDNPLAIHTIADYNLPILTLEGTVQRNGSDIWSHLIDLY
jgi:hypothetical protein